MNGARQKHADDDIHKWTVLRLAPYISGLLDEGEERKLNGHLAACPSCAERYDLLVLEARDSEAGEHIPPGVIAKWRTASAGLRGIERDLVQHHLDRCADCRRDLEILGCAPVLAPMALPVLPASRVPQNESRRRAVRISDGWRFWALGGWATTATAAAALLSVMLLRTPPPVQVANLDPVNLSPVGDPTPTPAPDRHEEPGRPVVASDLPAPARAASRLMLSRFVNPTGTSRGEVESGTSVFEVPRPRNGGTLSLRVRQNDLPQHPASTPTSVLLRDSQGDIVAEFATTLDSLRAHELLSLIPGDDDLPPGEYALVILMRPAAAESDSIVKRFRLVE